MSESVLLDISRLIFDAGRPTPTGILRVELAYAEYLISSMPDEACFAARNLFGALRLVETRRAKKLIAAISKLWRGESAVPRSVAILRCLFVWVHLTLLWQSGNRIRRTLCRGEKPPIYIIVSHANLEKPKAVERLKRKTGARLIFFIHDLIPMLFPEFETRGWDKRCERRMWAAVRLADAILVNSNHTRDSLLQTVGGAASVPRIIVVPLGLTAPPADTQRVEPPSCCYFVVIGTIEPKKNHYFLLSVWRQLRAEMGHGTPRLIVIGRRGWENENVLDMLERSRALAGVVEERGRLSDREIGPIIGGARALLLPSFAEGYGLPLSEALSAGVPVICSDIPAFREVGGDAPEFLDPLDGPSWRRAIVDYMAETSPRRQAQLDRLRHWRPPTWDSHFQSVRDLVNDLRA